MIVHSDIAVYGERARKIISNNEIFDADTEQRHYNSIRVPIQEIE
jgi:hypothetical protein